MIAYQCDRCGRFYNAPPTEEFMLYNNMMQKLDLCDECVHELYDWVNGGVIDGTKTEE